jgi:hypothetical protein
MGACTRGLSFLPERNVVFSHPLTRVSTPLVTTLLVLVLALLVAALVDGSLTQPSAAAAPDISRSIAHAPIEAKLAGFQLPTK